MARDARNEDGSPRRGVGGRMLSGLRPVLAPLLDRLQMRLTTAVNASNSAVRDEMHAAIDQLEQQYIEMNARLQIIQSASELMQADLQALRAAGGVAAPQADAPDRAVR